MNYMELKLAAITDSDLEVIKETASKPVKLSDLPYHKFFGHPVNLIKLTSVLSILREREKIANVVEAVGENPELRDPAALEILLTSNIKNWQSLSDISNDLKACLNIYATHDIVDPNVIRGISVFCKIQLVKHAALQKKWQIIKAVKNCCSEFEQQFLEEFLISLARFSALFLDRIKANADHGTWIEYCKMIDEHFCNPRSPRRGLLRSCMALLSANKGDLDGAESIMSSTKDADKHLRTSISMRRALRNNMHEAASGFADILISMSSPVTLTSEFSRETAELALKRVNKILIASGLKPFLISGTLLGCIREGRIFSHDKDFDIGVFGWESQYDVAAALLKSGDFAFSVKDLRGSKLFLLPVRHVPSGFDFDIFFFHDAGDHFLHGIDSRLGYTLNYQFSKFDLISRNFMGDDFLIPDNFKVMLAENYGENWQTPDPLYFVKLQSPALVRGNDALMGFVARHEMLDLIHKRGSLKKANALMECIKAHVPERFQPTKKTFAQFRTVIERGWS